MNKKIHNNGIKVEKLERLGRFIVAVVYKDDVRIKGYGISRCSQDDKFYDKIGEDLAVGRAKKALFRKIWKKRINNTLMG